jgi:hypothetical protein
MKSKDELHQPEPEPFQQREQPMARWKSRLEEPECAAQLLVENEELVREVEKLLRRYRNSQGEWLRQERHELQVLRLESENLPFEQIPAQPEKAKPTTQDWRSWFTCSIYCCVSRNDAGTEAVVAETEGALPCTPRTPRSPRGTCARQLSSLSQSSAAINMTSTQTEMAQNLTAAEMRYDSAAPSGWSLGTPSRAQAATGNSELQPVDSSTIDVSLVRQQWAERIAQERPAGEEPDTKRKGVL